MAESLVQVTEGSGKKLHTISRTVGANTVEDEIVILHDSATALYTIDAVNISTATANSHLIEVMAGTTLELYVRRIMMWQQTLATTAAICNLELWRLTTAGTGGTAYTPNRFDVRDGTASYTTMIVPTVKGTETGRFMGLSAGFIQTVPTSGPNPLILDLNFDQLHMKPIRIAPGVANGLTLKNVTAIAAATVHIAVICSEESY